MLLASARTEAIILALVTSSTPHLRLRRARTASRSASSLSGWPLWPRTHSKEMFTPRAEPRMRLQSATESVSSKGCRWPVETRARTSRAALESVRNLGPQRPRAGPGGGQGGLQPTADRCQLPGADAAVGGHGRVRAEDRVCAVGVGQDVAAPIDGLAAAPGGVAGQDQPGHEPALHLGNGFVGSGQGRRRSRQVCDRQVGFGSQQLRR